MLKLLLLFLLAFSVSIFFVFFFLFLFFNSISSCPSLSPWMSSLSHPNRPRPRRRRHALTPQSQISLRKLHPKPPLCDLEFFSPHVNKRLEVAASTSECTNIVSLWIPFCFPFSYLNTILYHPATLWSIDSLVQGHGYRTLNENQTYYNTNNLYDKFVDSFFTAIIKNMY